MIVSVVSYKGGVGKTTVTANLAASLRRIVPSVSVVDLDSQNALRLHFGVPVAIKNGIAMCDSSKQWEQVSYKSMSGVKVYPYGHVPFVKRLQFEQQLLNQDLHLSAWLKEIKNDELVLIDTPPGDNAAVRQAIMGADILLAIINTDGASFATIGLLDGLVRELRPELLNSGRMYYTLTNYDERNEMERAVQGAVHRVCVGRIAPISIHHDVALKEALACSSLLQAYDIHSQALLEFEQLAQWLSGKLKAGYL